MKQFIYNIHSGKYFVDLIIRGGSLWMGCHYSPRNKCCCFAILPCVVIRVGKTEYKRD